MKNEKSNITETNRSKKAVGFLNAIKSMFKFLIEHPKTILIVFSVFMIILFFMKYKNMEKKYETALRTKNDTISEYVNRIGTMYAMKETYVTNIRNLKKENEILYKEVKSLKDNPIVVSKVEYVTFMDTIVMNSVVYVDSMDKNEYSGEISYSDEWISFSGVVKLDPKTFDTKVTLNDIIYNDNLTMNIIEKDKQLYVIAKSDNPYTKINTIESAIVSPENSKVIRKRIVKPWGIMVGAGPTFTVMDGKFKVVPGIQVTVGYKIIGF